MIRNWLNRGGKSSLIQNMAAALGIGLGTAQPARWKYNTDPRAARHWHNPADPVQAARIEAAAAKRERKSRALGENADRAFMNNSAHTDGLRLPARFNPFHVAR